MDAIYPISFEKKIAFDDIRARLKAKCICPLGEEKVDEMQFADNYDLVMFRLRLTHEMLMLTNEEDKTLPVTGFSDIRSALQRVRIEGLYLTETELFSLLQSLLAVKQLVRFISKLEGEEYPNLKQLIEEVSTFDSIISAIEKIVDKFGKIKDNASPNLAKIRREIIQAQGNISKTLNAILRQAKADGYVDKDVSPSMRDGRLVIPITAALKRKINGIVHDESATGKTVFIEPTQVVEGNNRLRELEHDERREIILILTELTNALRPYFQEIVTSQYFLGEIDFLLAKSKFAKEVDALLPVVSQSDEMQWFQAIHPLLHLTLKKQHKKVVPLDIILNKNQRILIISGPNAGGKSVCLKTTALLQYMLQCGLLVPVNERSKMRIFNKIFIDIGDEQSIENDLSTYSSHLMNMKHFVKNSDAETLILIDEFGTGTEPQIGGAIAEACLERFNRNQSYGVITTHYTNLKHYAEDAEGVVNAAMLYDRQHLEPLFQLEIGNPGSSFAVDIARKIGLPEDVIQDASDKIGGEHLDYDKHLQDIVRDKRYWERKRQQIRLKEKRLSELLEKREVEMSKIDSKRKELERQAKQEAENLLKETNARIENTIRLIKESNADKEKTKKVRSELEEFKNKKILHQKTQSTSNSKKKKQNLPKKTVEKETIEVNDNVKLKGQTTIGMVLEIKNNVATVAFGQLKSSVKINQLEKISKNQVKKETRLQPSTYQPVSENIRSKKLTFKSEIDVRGMRGEEALQAVTYFIDDALMMNVGRVRILHGTGTGALRQMIRQYLSNYPGVHKYHDEHVQFGGAGITVVEFD